LSIPDPTPDRELRPARPQPGSTADGDPNVLRHYVGVLRRRYYWIVLGLVVGLVGGFVSTLFVHVSHDPISYYKATNTLLAPTSNTSAGDNSSGINLQQAAFLLRSAAVTDEVAKKLDVSPNVVNNQLAASPRSDVQAVDVTAISTDPNKAVQMANVAATALNEYVLSESREQYTQETNDVKGKVESLQAQQSDLEASLTAKGADPDLINARIESVVNQYRVEYDQYQSLLTEGSPSVGMSTAAPATPVQISGRAYQYRLSQNVNSRGAINGVTAAAPTFDETDLSSAPPVSKKLRLVIGATAGLIMGVATAFLVEAWDDRLRRRDRVETITGFPVIAEIPKLTRQQARDHSIPAVDAEGSRAAERYRAARTAILFGLDHVSRPDDDQGIGRVFAPVVMVTSPNPGEGKTTTVASLAAVLGDNGLRTLVIDCDFRKPAVSRYLAPSLNLLEPGIPVPTRLDGVSFLAAPRSIEGPADAVTRLRQAVADFRGQFDLLLLDTPPMLTTNDASDLLGVADAVVLVLRAGQTRTGPAQRVSIVLNRFRAEVLGVVFNGCEDAEMESYYGYADSYTYGYLDAPRSPVERPGAPAAAPTGAAPPPPEPSLPTRNGRATPRLADAPAPANPVTTTSPDPVPPIAPPSPGRS
jgi:Mrp family chromosome partitioning ATPase/capsular polysaccharide biosynthesis protein